MADANVPEAHDLSRRCGAKNRHGGHCTLVAGHGTNHKGVGRCKHHGGASPTRHGRYSTITRPAIRQRLDELESQDVTPLDLLPELRLLRALIIDYIERYDVFTEAILAWHASFLSETVTPKPRQILDVASASKLIVDCSRLIDTIHKMQQEQTISLDTFKRLMEQMGLTVTRYVSDADTLRAIERDWLDIRVEPGRADSRR